MAAILPIYRDALIKSGGNKTLACKTLSVPKLYMHKLSKIPEFKEMLEKFSKTKKQQDAPRKEFTKELFLQALEENDGYVERSIKALEGSGINVSRRTVYVWLKEDPDFLAAKNAIRELLFESCDSFLKGSQDWRARQAWLAANFPERGYGRDNSREMTLKISHEDAIKALAAEPEK